MTTNIDICNDALLEAGTQSLITSFTDGSAEGVVLGRVYDRCRQQLLRSAPWGFAKGQGTLELLASWTDPLTLSLGVGDGTSLAIGDGTSLEVGPNTNLVPYPWHYKYANPNDCLYLRYVVAPPMIPGSGYTNVPLTGEGWTMPLRPSKHHRFEIGNDITQGKVILSNVPAALGVYTRDITDPDLFDALFSDALVQLIAFRIVIPLAGNVGEKQGFAQSVQQALQVARVADANESVTMDDHTPDWIRARGGGWAGEPFGLAYGQWYTGWDPNAWVALT